MSNIQLISDLHFDANIKPYRHTKVQSANVLLIAGDVGNPRHLRYIRFLEAMSGMYEHVVIIFGNHEYYCNDCSFEELETEFRTRIKHLTNVYFLQKDTVKIGETTFLGVTLWSKIDEAKKSYIKNSMNDYKLISKSKGVLFTPDDCNKIHDDHLKWLCDTVANLNGPYIIITHHIPIITNHTIHPTLGGRGLDSCFVSDLTDHIEHFSGTWCYGHNHLSKDFMYNKIRFVSNQYGYMCDRSYFKPLKTLALGECPTTKVYKKCTYKQSALAHHLLPLISYISFLYLKLHRWLFA